MSEKLCTLRTRGGGMSKGIKASFCIVGTSANTTYGQGCASTDTTLMDLNAGSSTQSTNYTVKRNAKGKIGFSFMNRGAITSYPAVKLNNVDIYNGRLDDWIISEKALLDVTLSANDIISVTCGRSTAQSITVYFIEE